MDITIKNCNNIDDWIININEGCLNIKYAINGTWKTSISKAISLSMDDKLNWFDTLSKLKPFKYRTLLDHNPEIHGLESFNKIKVFDEDYVNTYVFKPNEVVQNSFDIFIKNERYDQWLVAITKLIDEIGITFQENEDLDIFIKDLNKIVDCSGKSGTWLAGNGSFIKALGGWNLIEHIPLGLEEYTEYIKSDKNIPWLWWQIKGNAYLEISDKCPYCTSWITEKKNKILWISEKYETINIEHLNKVIDALGCLTNYFTDDTKTNIDKITKNMDWLTKQDKLYLFNIKIQSEQLSERLLSIKKLNFHTLKDIDKIIELLNEYKINIEYYWFFNTEYTKDKIKLINWWLEHILGKAGVLQWEVNKQKILIRDTIQEYKEEINSFLKYAGYNYNIDSIEDKETYRLTLKHNDDDNELNDAKAHLSFGERNALALVLFMFDSIKQWADLIILDDPISSFDKNKKFAIIDMLFKKTKSLRNKTVLMLTHDFEPVIDIIYNNLPTLDNISNAYFLENDNGNIKETEIKKSDIRSFIDIAEENINILGEDINKMIYLRRLYEINNERNDAYELLSSLFHKRETPWYKDGTAIEQKKIDNWTFEINKNITNFEYNKYHSKVTNTKYMIELYNEANNNYEKLQLYRIIKNGKSESNIITKFINESYHIENDYLFQLNPCKYQLVPQYIINECNKDVHKIETE